MTTIDITASKQIPAVFAYNGEKASISDTSDADGLSYPDGIPAKFSTSVLDGGAYFTRKMANRLGWLATLSTMLGQIGHVYGFSTDVANSEGVCPFDDGESTGDYPEGAVVDYLDEMEGVVRRLRSMKENNASTQMFGDIPSNPNWAVADNIDVPDYKAFWSAVYEFVNTGTTADNILYGESGDE